MTYWRDEWNEIGFFSHIEPFEDYAVDIIQSDNHEIMKKIFEFTELLIQNENEVVQTTMTTSFLEYLSNISPEKIQFRKFVQYMGQESIEYCRAWDEFTGVKTDGLWDHKRFHRFLMIHHLK